MSSRSLRMLAKAGMVGYGESITDNTEIALLQGVHIAIKSSKMDEMTKIYRA